MSFSIASRLFFSIFSLSAAAASYGLPPLRPPRRGPSSPSRGRPPTPPPDENYPMAEDYTFNTVSAQEFGDVIVGEVRESK